MSVLYYKRIIAIAFVVIAIAIIVIAIVVIAFTWDSDSTSNIRKHYLKQDDNLIVVDSSFNVTEHDAMQIINETNMQIENERNNGIDVIPDVKDYLFSSIEQAQNEMNMIVVLPTEIPWTSLSSIVGMSTVYAGLNEPGDTWGHNVIRVTFDGINERIIVITVDKHIISELKSNSFTFTTFHSDREVYKSKLGYEFIIDDNDTYCATIMVGGYDYTISSVGMSSKEMKEIIDSVDLSVYL